MIFIVIREIKDLFYYSRLSFYSGKSYDLRKEFNKKQNRFYIESIDSIEPIYYKYIKEAIETKGIIVPDYLVERLQEDREIKDELVDLDKLTFTTLEENDKTVYMYDLMSINKNIGYVTLDIWLPVAIDLIAYYQVKKETEKLLLEINIPTALEKNYEQVPFLFMLISKEPNLDFVFVGSRYIERKDTLDITYRYYQSLGDKIKRNILKLKENIDYHDFYNLFDLKEGSYIFLTQINTNRRFSNERRKEFLSRCYPAKVHKINENGDIQLQFLNTFRTPNEIKKLREVDELYKLPFMFRDNLGVSISYKVITYNNLNTYFIQTLNNPYWLFKPEYVALEKKEDIYYIETDKYLDYLFEQWELKLKRE